MKWVLAIVLSGSLLLSVGCTTQKPATETITQSKLVKADFIPAKDVKDADFWILEFEDGTKMSLPQGPYDSVETFHPDTSYKLGQTYKVWKRKNVTNETRFHIEPVLDK